jgi:YgiT-type zinc finger domain-containing protein
MCIFCRTGILRQGTTTETLERDNTIIVVKGVPALVCNQCGEAYTDEEVTENLLAIAEQEMGKGTRRKEVFLQYTVPCYPFKSPEPS